jgi:hypothetical protein
VILKSGALLASGPLRPRSLTPDSKKNSDPDLPNIPKSWESFFQSSENQMHSYTTEKVSESRIKSLSELSHHKNNTYKTPVIRQSSMDSQLDGMRPRSRVFVEDYEPLVLTAFDSSTTSFRTTKGVMKQSREARSMSPSLHPSTQGLRSLSVDSMWSAVTLADDLADEKFSEVSWPITVPDAFPATWTSHPVPTSFSRSMQSLPWKGVTLSQKGPRKSTTSPFLGSGSVTIHSHHAATLSMPTHKSLGVVCGHPTATVSHSQTGACGGVLTKRTVTRGCRDSHKVGGVGMPFRNAIRRM